MRLRNFPLAVVLAAAAFVTGCGGASGSQATGENPGDGKQIFSDSCAGCHQFAPAGSGGGSGPDLDGTSLTVQEIAAQVRDGGGGMPNFSGKLTEQQIQAVSEFVAGE